MRKMLVLVFTLSLFLGLVGCKSKQQTVALTSAHAEAGKSTSTVRGEVKPNSSTSGEYNTPAYGGDLGASSKQQSATEPEKVRDERFTLDSEERNVDVIKMKYHVVVGSFKNRDNAKKLQGTLNSEGNNAVIVVNEQGMYRVLIASYNEYMDARNRINQINNRFPDAWVLVQKQ